jgi:hypothetical protein
MPSEIPPLLAAGRFIKPFVSIHTISFSIRKTDLFPGGLFTVRTSPDLCALDFIPGHGIEISVILCHGHDSIVVLIVEPGINCLCPGGSVFYVRISLRGFAEAGYQWQKRYGKNKESA